MQKCVNSKCDMHNITTNHNGPRCVMCGFPYPGVDGGVSVPCPRRCVGGRIREGAVCCDTCHTPAHEDVMIVDQIDLIIIRKITDWIPHIEKTARSLMVWNWWMGPVRYVHAVEFCIQVVLKKFQHAQKQWGDSAIREALSRLEVIPRKGKGSEGDMRVLVELFRHIGKTLECLAETKGECTSNERHAKERKLLTKTIKEHISFDFHAEAFMMPKLRVGDFKGDVSAMDKAELRSNLEQNGVLVKKKKRTRDPCETVVNARKKDPSATAAAQSEAEPDVAPESGLLDSDGDEEEGAKDGEKEVEGKEIKGMKEVETGKGEKEKKEVEAENFKSLCATLKKRIVKVKGDGHCLFHALAAAVSGHGDFQALRNLAADALESDTTFLSDFLASDPGESHKGDETTNLRKYCRGVRRKKFGGELELRILSQVLKVRIQVYESLGLRTVYPDDSSYGKLKWPVVGLTYHKYLCAAPHYQRLVDA